MNAIFGRRLLLELAGTGAVVGARLRARPRRHPARRVGLLSSAAPVGWMCVSKDPTTLRPAAGSFRSTSAETS